MAERSELERRLIERSAEEAAAHPHTTTAGLLAEAAARIAEQREEIHRLRNLLGESATRERLAVMRARAHPEPIEERS